VNVAEISARLYAIGAAILDKTGETPWIAPTLKIADGKCSVDLYREYGNGNDYIIGTATGVTVNGALDDAERIIAALPRLDDAKLHRHMARLADCVDQARDDGIADEYVQPLRITVAAMSENLLAAPEDAP